MTPPSVPFSTWILAAFDPILIVVAVYLGWKADQAGKIFIAAIAALGVTLLADWLITGIGIPWMAPVSRNAPTLLPVRSVAACLWAALAFGARRLFDAYRG
ncbi:hypothetical protein [Enterovirga sp.]|uniref:hypothetical protein n=1 Tax=Enterovirga sp. TaxID=2026350 RepID=UPI002CF229E3|nr:hypothetical protein [Enterovirga sp.]HMO30561.1 hypothetical protein [Enterovirga sp.]